MGDPSLYKSEGDKKLKPYFMARKKKTVKNEILARIDKLGIHIDKIDTRVDSLGTHIDKLGTRINTLDTRMDKLETHVSNVLEAIQLFSNRVDERFDKLEGRVGNLESTVGEMKSTMVTKDYLDKKLGSNEGESVSLVRKEDEKLFELVNILRKRKVISALEAEKVTSMEPFAVKFD